MEKESWDLGRRKEAVEQGCAAKLVVLGLKSKGVVGRRDRLLKPSCGKKAKRWRGRSSWQTTQKDVPGINEKTRRNSKRNPERRTVLKKRKIIVVQ